MSIINPLIGVSYLVFTLAFAFLLLGIANVFISFKLKDIKSRLVDTKENIEERLER